MLDVGMRHWLAFIRMAIYSLVPAQRRLQQVIAHDMYCTCQAQLVLHDSDRTFMYSKQAMSL